MTLRDFRQTGDFEPAVIAAWQSMLDSRGWRGDVALDRATRVPRTTATRLRSQLVPDEEFYEQGEVIRELIHLGRVHDDNISAWHHLQKRGSVRGLTFHRAQGDSAFSRREVRMLALLNSELRRLTLELPLERTEPKLPPRLRRLKALLQTDLSQKQIAAQLGLSYETVRSYAKELYGILGIQTREQLMTRARRS